MNKNNEQKALEGALQKRSFRIGGNPMIYAPEFEKITFYNVKLPKTPINCRKCEIQGKKANMRPICFVRKSHKYNELYNLFIVFECAACGEKTIIRYVEYLDLITPKNPTVKPWTPKDREKSDLDIIKRVYGLTTDEETISKKKELDEAERKREKKYENERLNRLATYEEEERNKKSAEKKALIQSGELLYDKRNHVFYYKSTGKVYK